MRCGVIYVLLVALAIGLWLLVACKQPTYDWVRIMHVVHHDETLWSICQEYCPSSMDIQEYICLIEQENNMTSATIHAGDILFLLKEVNTK